MSDSQAITTEDVQTPDAEVQSTEEVDTPAEPTLEELKAEVEKWKNFSRSNERKAKENLTAAQELQALKEAELSEIDKLTARAERAETELETVRLEALKNRIATKHGLSEEDIELFLNGTEESVLEAQAEALAKRIQASKKSRQVTIDNSDIEGVPEVNQNSALAKQMFKF